jgi:hypothetical protein
MAASEFAPRLRSLLVVAEVAISLMLLIGAGLLIRSFVRLQNVLAGIRPEGVVSMRLGGTRARQFQNRDEAVAYFRPFGEALADRAWRHEPRRGFGPAVHIVGWLGRDQRRGLDVRSPVRNFRSISATADTGLFQDDEDSGGEGALRSSTPTCR